MTEELNNEDENKETVTTPDNVEAPKKNKKKKKKKIKSELPQYLIDAQKAGDKATSRRLKTHAKNTPKLLGVEGLDPRLSYRWVDKSSGGNVGMRETQGWAIVHDDNLNGPRHSGSSMIDTHDSVLMATSRENYDELSNLAPRRSQERIKGAMAESQLENMRKTDITEETYETALQAEQENTIFE